ncbi:MAG: hypothetical protein WD995_14410, partial [Gemmatimonadota bacterium]
SQTALASQPPSPPLEIRLIDAGGVGIPADTAAWGTTYSHATHAFDHLVTDGPPWLEPTLAEAVRRDWIRYVRRMSGFGSNAVVVDAFLELVNFDGAGSGTEVYGAHDPMRHRHEALRAYFNDLAGDAAGVGMSVYLKTDLPAVTPALERYLRSTQTGADTGAESAAMRPASTGDPAFWDVYARGLDEIFTRMPGVAGVVVRIGEAGPLFNVEGTEYASYMGVRTPEQLRTMLRTLLPVFEAHGRTMIFRSWSVGLGPLGQLHNDPAVYEAALGPVESPALVVSTKFVQGDYFGFLPINPTLFVGEHRRIVEYQARREFEGFGALPNYLGKAHAASLAQIRTLQPNVVGISQWAQEGGPLRAGPLSLYDVEGFWRWTDASVYATTRLAVDPTRSPRALAQEWAHLTFDGSHPDGVLPSEAADRVADLLMTSREALEKAWYIRPYARQRVEIAGIEVPPILWIFEWDVVGGWSSVLSTLYRTVSGDLESSIAEGMEAIDLTRAMARTLDDLEPHLATHPDYPAMVRSLEYQESLFETLAAFRATFLLYYRWLDAGGDGDDWRRASERFLTAAQDHRARFAADLDFPAFDFEPAVRWVSRARGVDGAQASVRAILLATLLAVGLGTRHGRTSLRPYPGTTAARPTATAVGAEATGGAHIRAGGIALVAAAVTAGAAAAVLPDAGTFAVAVFALVLVYALAIPAGLSRSWAGALDRGVGVAAVGPLVLLAALPLGVTAMRGPDHFWFLFWTADALRALLFGTAISTGLWVLLATHVMGVRSTGSRVLSASALCLATGGVLVLLSALLPDLEGLLRALDEPLGVFPMTHAIVNAVTHYAGTPGWVVWTPGILGAVLILAGLTLRTRPSARAALR